MRRKTCGSEDLMYRFYSCRNLFWHKCSESTSALSQGLLGVNWQTLFITKWIRISSCGPWLENELFWLCSVMPEQVFQVARLRRGITENWISWDWSRSEWRKVSLLSYITLDPIISNWYMVHKYRSGVSVLASSQWSGKESFCETTL